ncbi:hypothetical protein ACFLVH_01705 [Chloroflexota bacterium]
MKLVRVAVEKQRWDLAAHIIVLATASVLKDGNKIHASKGVSRNPSLMVSSCSEVGRLIQSGGREVEKKKRCPKGQSER